MKQDIPFELIVTIVNKGHSGSVLDASKSAGAEGGTILPARGSGIHETARLFSFTIDPEKEVVFTLVPEAITDQVLEAIVTATGLDEPGKGIAFVMEVEKTLGINHPLGSGDSKGA